MAKVVRAGKKAKAQITPPPKSKTKREDLLDEVVRTRSRKNPKFKEMLETKLKDKMEKAVVQPDISQGEMRAMAEIMKHQNQTVTIPGDIVLRPVLAVMEEQHLSPVDAARALTFGQSVQTLLNRASDPTKLTVPEQAETFNGLVELMASFQDAFDRLKDHAKKHIVEHGEAVEGTGGKTVYAEGWTWPVTVHTPEGTLDDKKVEAMLRAKGFNPETFMEKVVKLKAVREKLDDVEGIRLVDLQACEKEAVWSLQAPRKATEKGEIQRSDFSVEGES